MIESEVNILDNVDQLSISVSSLQRVFDCPICLDMLKDPVRTTVCGHSFCKMCITKVLRKHTKEPCPICKALLSHRSIVDDEKMASFVQLILELIMAINMDTGIDITRHSAKRSSTNEASQNSEEFFKKKPDVISDVKESTEEEFKRPNSIPKQPFQTEKERINQNMKSEKKNRKSSILNFSMTVEQKNRNRPSTSKSHPYNASKGSIKNVPFLKIGYFASISNGSSRPLSIFKRGYPLKRNSNEFSTNTDLEDSTSLSPKRLKHKDESPKSDCVAVVKSTSSVFVQTSPIKFPVNCKCSKYFTNGNPSPDYPGTGNDCGNKVKQTTLEKNVTQSGDLNMARQFENNDVNDSTLQELNCSTDDFANLLNKAIILDSQSTQLSLMKSFFTKTQTVNNKCTDEVSAKKSERIHEGNGLNYEDQNFFSEKSFNEKKSQDDNNVIIIDSEKVDSTPIPTPSNPFLKEKQSKDKKMKKNDDMDIEIIQSTGSILIEHEPLSQEKDNDSEPKCPSTLPNPHIQSRNQNSQAVVANNETSRIPLNEQISSLNVGKDLKNGSEENQVPDTLPFSELIYHKGSRGTLNSTCLTEILDTQQRNALEKECAELKKQIEMAENGRTKLVGANQKQPSAIEAQQQETEENVIQDSDDESLIATTPPSTPFGGCLSQSIWLSRKAEAVAAESQLSVIPNSLVEGEQNDKIHLAVMKSLKQPVVKSPLMKDKNENMAISLEEPLKAKRNFSFVFSRLTDVQLKELKAFARIVNADITNNICENTTHVIIRPDDENRAPHTFKYLKGVAMKIWVISVEWVSASIRAKQLLNEDKFLVLDSSGVAGPWRCKNVSDLPLSNFIISPVPPFNTITSDQLCDLALLCGAEIVDDIELLKNRPLLKPRILLTDDDLEVETIERYLEDLSIVPLNVEWLLEVVGRYELVPLSPFLHVPLPREVLQCLVPEDLIVDDSEDEGDEEESEDNPSRDQENT